MFGLCDSVRGPTLLDLGEVYHVDIGRMSLIFTFFSAGSMTGCLLSSVLLDRLSNYRFLVLGVTLLILGISTAVLPFPLSIILAYTVSFVFGASSGLKMTGGNVL